MDTDLNDIFRKLFKSGGIIFVGYIFDLSISFFAKAAIARILGPVDYGDVYLGITVLTLASTLCLLGLQNGVARYLPRFDKDADKLGIFLSATYIVVPLSILVGVFVVITAPFIADVVFPNSNTTRYIRIFGAVIPFAVVMKLTVGGIQGLNLATPRVVVENITLSLSRILFVVVAVLVGADAIGIAFAYALPYLIAAALGTYYVYRHLPTAVNDTPRIRSRELLVFSVPLVVSGGVSFLLNDLDTLMLGYYEDSFSVGVYNVIYPIAQLLMVFLSSFGFLFMPIISMFDSNNTNESDRNKEIVYRAITKWIFLSTIPILFVVVLFPSITIQYTFGSDYQSGSTTLVVLALAFFSHAVTGPNSGILAAIGETKIIMWDNFIVGFLNLVLNIMLIPRYGFFGAGVATAISYAFLNVLFSSQVYLKTGIHPFSDGLMRSGVISFSLISVAYWLLETFLLRDIYTALIFIFAFMTIYSLIILRWGIEQQEVMLVNSFEERFDVDLTWLKQIANNFIR